MEREPFMPVEPLTDLRVLVRRVIIEDHMHRLAGGNLSLDGVEEANELLMPMALHVTAYDRAIENVQRGKQRCCSVPFVVMRHGSGAPLLQRQARLRSVERLYLALLVYRKHNGVRRWIYIKPYDIAQFIDKFRIVRELELPDAMRLKPMGAPDALNRADRDAGCLRHQRTCPMRRLSRRLIKRHSDDASGDGVAQRLDARGPRLVVHQPFEALLRKAFLPAPDGGLRLVCLAHDLHRTKAISGEQNNPGAPYVLLWRVTVLDQSHKSPTIGG